MAGKDTRIANISSEIRIIPDFSKPGILFQDITTLLHHPKAFKDTIDLFVERYKLVHILSLLIMYTEAAVLHQLRCLKNLLFHLLMACSTNIIPLFLLMVRHVQWELVIEMVTINVLSPKSWMQYSTRLKLRDMKLNSSYMFPSLREHDQ